MARRCAFSGRGVQSGNNVSHAHNKTRRRYLPNMQRASLLSETLGTTISLRISARGLKTVDKAGGLDAFLRKAKAKELPADLRRLRKHVIAREASKTAE